MSLQRLAPQAYTKETLIKAFEWLQSQDDSIKSIATSVDALISLYMKAKLQGEESLHRLSIKNFKNDLQNLASIVGDWEHSAGAHHQPASHSSVSPGGSPLAPSAIHAGPPASGSLAPSTLASKSQVQPSSPLRNQVPSPSDNPAGSIMLPPELERDLAELTRSLHLSHREEALRMALRIGVEQLKKLI